MFTLLNIYLIGAFTIYINLLVETIRQGKLKRANFLPHTVVAVLWPIAIPALSLAIYCISKKSEVKK